MKKIVFGIFFLGCIQASSQSLDRSVLSTGGAYSQATGINLSATIGEIAVTTLTGASSILTQGFQQPDGLFVGIVDPVSGTLSWNAYPNPVSSLLTLELSSAKNEDLVISCHDLLGRMVLPVISTKVIAGERMRVELDVQHLTPAMYLVRILRKDNPQEMETIRIIKSH